MVNYLIGKVIGKPVVGLQGVTVDARSNLNVLTYQLLQIALLASANDLCADLAATLQNSRYDCLVAGSASNDFCGAFIFVHVPFGDGTLDARAGELRDYYKDFLLEEFTIEAISDTAPAVTEIIVRAVVCITGKCLNAPALFGS